MRALQEDTRQQRHSGDKHSTKHEGWAAAGVAVVRSKLAFGDYALVPAASVDTKRDIQELAQDVFQQHDRFRRELVGARDAGTKLYILTENDEGIRSLADLAAWKESAKQFAKRKGAQVRIDGGRLAKACATMERKYQATFLFCAPEESAALIVELLRKEG